MKTVGSFADVLRSQFLFRSSLHRLNAQLDCVPLIVHQFRIQHHTYHIALAMEKVSAGQEECASAELVTYLIESLVMLTKQFEDLSHCLRFVLKSGLMRSVV